MSAEVGPFLFQIPRNRSACAWETRPLELERNSHVIDVKGNLAYPVGAIAPCCASETKSAARPAQVGLFLPIRRDGRLQPQLERRSEIEAKAPGEPWLQVIFDLKFRRHGIRVVPS